MSTNTDVSEAPKFCVNCKHVGTNASRDKETYRCFHPNNSSELDMVSGDKIYSTPYCRQHRTVGICAGVTCTAQGNWYEAKPPASQEYPLGAATPQPFAAKLKIKTAANLLQDLGL